MSSVAIDNSFRCDSSPSHDDGGGSRNSALIFNKSKINQLSDPMKSKSLAQERSKD